jgi:hypothetical protein
VVRVVVVLVLERVFVVGGEVAATTRALTGRGRDLDQISVAKKQETGPAEMRCQPEGAVEPLGEHAFGFRRLVSKELAVLVGEDRGDKVGDGVGVGRHLTAKAPTT